MKKFASLFLADMRRGLRCQSFWLTIVAVALCFWLSGLVYAASAGLSVTQLGSAVYLLGLAYSGTLAGTVIYGVLPLLPFSGAMADDMRERAHIYYLLRAGADRYVVSKFTANVLLGGLALFLGQLLFVSSARFAMPLTLPQDSNMVDAPFDTLLSAGHPMVFLLVYSGYYGLTGVLFASVAFCVSSFTESRFIIYSMPMVIYYVVLRICTTFTPPAAVQPQVIVELVYPSATVAGTFLMKALKVAVICLALLIISLMQVKRRVRNE